MRVGALVSAAAVVAVVVGFVVLGGGRGERARVSAPVGELPTSTAESTRTETLTLDVPAGFEVAFVRVAEDDTVALEGGAGLAVLDRAAGQWRTTDPEISVEDRCGRADGAEGFFLFDCGGEGLSLVFVGGHGQRIRSAEAPLPALPVVGAWAEGSLYVWNVDGEGAKYEPTSGEWSSVARTEAFPRSSDPLVAVALEGSIVVWRAAVDGLGLDPTATSVGDIYHLDTDSWSDIAAAPIDEFVPAAANFQGNLVVASTDIAGRPFTLRSRVAILDLGTQQWSSLPEAPTSGTICGAYLLPTEATLYVRTCRGLFALVENEWREVPRALSAQAVVVPTSTGLVVLDGGVLRIEPDATLRLRLS